MAAPAANTTLGSKIINLKNSEGIRKGVKSIISIGLRLSSNRLTSAPRRTSQRTREAAVDLAGPKARVASCRAMMGRMLAVPGEGRTIKDNLAT